MRENEGEKEETGIKNKTSVSVVFRNGKNLKDFSDFLAEKERSNAFPIYNGGVLKADNIQRTYPSFKIDSNLLRVPEFIIKPDPVFVERYKAYKLGEINAYATRVALDDILAGYYLSSLDNTLVQENTPEEIIERQCKYIRAGGRPTLWVRENDSFRNAPRFFNSDSISSLKAYQKLGISSIPVAIVAKSPPRNLPNSSFVVGHGGELKDPIDRIESFLPCEVGTVPALAPLDSPLPEVLTRAKDSLTTLIDRLKAFHCDNEMEPLHYHDSIFSALIRARDAVTAIEILGENDLWTPTISLHRSIYELHLSFYIDWIAPEESYAGLSIAATTSRQMLKDLEDKLTDSYSIGRSRSRGQKFAKRALIFVRWLEKISNKAQFVPIGIALHSKYYHLLSSVAHQDFEQTATHANRFRSPSFDYIGEQNRNALSNFLSIVVGSTTQLIANDLPSHS